MTVLLQDFINLFGLGYMPTTVGEFMTWMILVLCAIALVCSVIRAMFYLCELSLRGGFKR